MHFMLSYDHPFVDGNGRTARILFYWSMLSQDYWLAEFLPISRLLKMAPSQYARSFIYTEHGSAVTVPLISGGADSRRDSALGQVPNRERFTERRRHHHLRVCELHGNALPAIGLLFLRGCVTVRFSGRAYPKLVGGIMQRCALSSVAPVSRWRLLLLSPSLSTAIRL